MSNPKTIAFNTLLLSVCRITSVIVQSIAFIIIARSLGKNGLGLYSVVFAYLSFFQIITGLGIDSLVIKELSINDRHASIIGNAIILKLIGGVLAAVLSVMVLQFCGYGAEVKKIIYIVSLSLLFGFSSTFAGLFQHHMKAYYYSLPEMIISMLTSVAMVVAAVMGAPILLLVVFNAFSIILVIAICWILCVIKLKLKPVMKLDPIISKKLLKAAWPILIASFFIAINTRIDQVMLYRLKGDAALGEYSAVVKLTEGLNFIAIAFSTVMFPFMCQSYTRSQEKFVFVFRRAFKYMAMIIIPVAFGTCILAGPIMDLIYGNKFTGSTMILAVLIWSQIFVFMGCINGNILVILGQQKLMSFLTMASAVSNVLLNFWLIPSYSGLGSAIATLVSYSLIGAFLQALVLATRPIMVDYFVATIKPTIASVIMGITIYCLLSLPLAAVILISVTTYVAVMLLIKGVDAVDIDYIRQIMAKRKVSDVIE